MIILIGFISSLILSVYWILKRRQNRRKHRNQSEQKMAYSKMQIFGIASILLFLMPIFFTVFTQLVRGILILSLFLFRIVNIPEIAVSILIALLIPCLYFLVFIGLYVVGEYVWPKKSIVEA